jgi:hypothetical protein
MALSKLSHELCATLNEGVVPVFREICHCSGLFVENHVKLRVLLREPDVEGIAVVKTIVGNMLNCLFARLKFVAMRAGPKIMEDGQFRGIILVFGQMQFSYVCILERQR